MNGISEDLLVSGSAYELENRRPTTEHLLASVYDEMCPDTHQLLDVRVKCESLRHDCPCFGSTSTHTIQFFTALLTSIGLWTHSWDAAYDVPAVARGFDGSGNGKLTNNNAQPKSHTSQVLKARTTQNKNPPRAPTESQQSSELFELFRRP